MKRVYLILLAVCLSFGVQAKTHKRKEINGQLMNYTSIDSSAFVIEVNWNCTNGWGGYLKEGIVTASVNEDGTFTIPKIKVKCFSVWGTEFRTRTHIKTVSGQVIKSDIHHYQKNTLYILEIAAKKIDTKIVYGCSGFEAKVNISSIIDGYGGSFLGAKTLEGKYVDGSILFEKEYIVIARKDDQQFELEFNFDFQVVRSNGKVIYDDREFNVPFNYDVIDIPFDDTDDAK